MFLKEECFARSCDVILCKVMARYALQLSWHTQLIADEAHAGGVRMCFRSCIVLVCVFAMPMSTVMLHKMETMAAVS